MTHEEILLRKWKTVKKWLESLSDYERISFLEDIEYAPKCTIDAAYQGGLDTGRMEGFADGNEHGYNEAIEHLGDRMNNESFKKGFREGWEKRTYEDKEVEDINENNNI